MHPREDIHSISPMYRVTKEQTVCNDFIVPRRYSEDPGTSISREKEGGDDSILVRKKEEGRGDLIKVNMGGVYHIIQHSQFHNGGKGECWGGGGGGIGKLKRSNSRQKKKRRGKIRRSYREECFLDHLV